MMKLCLFESPPATLRCIQAGGSASECGCTEFETANRRALRTGTDGGESNVSSPIRAHRYDASAAALNLTLRWRSLDATPGHVGATMGATWVEHHTPIVARLAETAVVVIDMWDFHPCPCAYARWQKLAISINETISHARAAGILIIHAPSDVVGSVQAPCWRTWPPPHNTNLPCQKQKYYQNHAAHRWVRSLPTIPRPTALIPQPILTDPIDASDGGCDCPQPLTHRKHVGVSDHITIDGNDALIDGNDGQSLHNLVVARGIRRLIYVGVAVNMCILHRQTGALATKAWGLEALVVRDLTDAMYNPAMPPFLNDHEAGTQLFLEFLEKRGTIGRVDINSTHQKGGFLPQASPHAQASTRKEATTHAQGPPHDPHSRWTGIPTISSSQLRLRSAHPQAHS